MPEKSFQVTSWNTVRSNLTGLTLLIITTKQSITFYGKMYGKVQYRTPIPSHVPVKVNTVTCASKGFVTPNEHDELPHSFYSTTDNNNYQKWHILPRWVLGHIYNLICFYAAMIHCGANCKHVFQFFACNSIQCYSKHLSACFTILLFKLVFRYCNSTNNMIIFKNNYVFYVF